MRAEKKYLVEEIYSYLDSADYFFLANYERITVEETSALRTQLKEFDAEFHVIKNRMFKVAAEDRGFPDLSECLIGPTAIISGGSNPPGAAKTIERFFKETEKVALKGGVLAKQMLTAEDISELAKLPSIDILRAQLMGLLQTPAQQMATILQAAQQSFLNVLDAKVKS